ncbi:MAG: LamG domain-containing protein, partial [Bacteroidales bacterium]|nr:LamG domain-containing protein [Bacteroidales bacterium]
FFIGGDDNGSGKKIIEHFNGFIDDVRLYSYALTVNDILEILAIEFPGTDIVRDRMIDLLDFSVLAANWMYSNCYSKNLCNGSDLNADQIVNQDDLLLLSQEWLKMVQSITEKIENDNSGLVYSGNWSVQSETTDSGESMSWSKTLGDNVVYSFFGDRVIVFVRYGAYGGICDVKLDGEVVASNVNTYANPAVAEVEIYDSGTIKFGEHVVELIAKGNGNTMFDFFYIEK